MGAQKDEESLLCKTCKSKNCICGLIMKTRMMLGTLALTAVVGCATIEKSFNKAHQIYRDNKAKIIVLHTKFKYTAAGVEHDYDQSGIGFCVGNKILTMEHVVNKAKHESQTPFGLIEFQTNMISRVVRIKGKEKPLELIVENAADDVALFKVPKGTNCYEKDDLGDSDDLYVGMKLYNIGRPLVGEITLKKGMVGSLKGYENLKEINVKPKNVFMFLGSLYAGDSGSPFFGRDGKIYAVAQGTFQYMKGLSWATRINVFKKYMRDNK